MFLNIFIYFILKLEKKTKHKKHKYTSGHILYFFDKIRSILLKSNNEVQL